jgi:hypothetical protein
MFDFYKDKYFRYFLMTVISVLSVIVLYQYFNLFRNALIDDTFITLSYASSLRTYVEWGFYHGWISNTATSPLNVILISLFNIGIPDIISAAIFLTAVEAFGIVYFLMKISKTQFQNNLFAMTASLSTLLNPLLLSTIGLESFLFCCIFTCSLLCLIRKKPFFLGISLGLLTLTRPDGWLFVSLLVGYYILHQTTREAKTRTFYRLTLTYLIIVAPWYLFSWIHLGSFVPETLFIKIHQDWGGNIVTGVPLYFGKYPLEMAIAFISVPLSILFFQKTTSVFKYLLPFCVITYFLCYLFFDVPPYHWYYVPILYPIILIGSYGFSVFAHERRLRKTLVVTGLAIPLAGFAMVLSRQCDIPPHDAFIHSNWGNQTQYKAIAQWLSDSIATTQPIIVKGEVGTIAFFCNHRMCNYFTAGQEDSIIVDRLHRKSLISRLCFSVNHLFWKPRSYYKPFKWTLRLQPDYRDTIQSYNELKHWFITSRFDTMGIGVARLFPTSGKQY